MEPALDNATLWWIAAALLVGAELLSGTFFLLMLSLGAVTAALLTYLGLPVADQIAAAAIVSSLAALGWFVLRGRRKTAPTRANATRNKLDIGGTVTVEHWQPDGTAQVAYRGAPWTAIAAGAATPLQAGQHRVVDILNNRLVLEPLDTARST